jgi:hypothetical protein
MSLPTGFRTPDGFVCWACRHPDMPQHGAGIRLDARVASGEECIKCGDKMPYLAKVRLAPDGAVLVKAPSDLRPRGRSLLVQRETEVLIDSHALLYLDIGCGPELGVEMTPGGRVKIWVHTDPDGESPAAEWEFDPFATQPHPSTESGGGEQ